MKKTTSVTNNYFLEILPDYISQDKIFEIFSKDRIKHFSQNIKTAFIISSEPVNSQIYLGLINAFNNSGINVLSFYFDTPDVQHVDTLVAAVHDLQNALATGGCLIISYRSALALPMIACLHIFNGKNVDEAMTAVQQIRKDSSGILPLQGHRVFAEVDAVFPLELFGRVVHQRPGRSRRRPGECRRWC